MTTQDSRVAVKREGDIVLIDLLDQNILEEMHIHTIGVEIGQVIDENAVPKIVINFDNVEHLSSAALGAMININNKILEKGGQLRLSNIDPRVYEIFMITKLNKIFQIHDDREQAIKSFE